MLKTCILLNKWCVRFTRLCCIVTTAAMCVLVTMQIVFRIVGKGFGWTDELSRYCMVWMAMFAASLMVADNSDVRLEFVTKRLPFKMANIVEAINVGLIFIFLCVLGYFGLEKAFSASAINATSMKISLMWFYMAIPVGTILMIIQLICRTVISISTNGALLKKED